MRARTIPPPKDVTLYNVECADYGCEERLLADSMSDATRAARKHNEETGHTIYISSRGGPKIIVDSMTVYATKHVGGK